MNEISQLSLTDLREVASLLAVPGARVLPREQLLHQLAPLAAEVADLVNTAPAGRLVLSRPAPAAMTATDRESAGAPPPSGAGRSNPQPLKAPAFVIPDLPWAYDDDRIVLLVRDPHTLYTYWDFHADTIARASEGLESPRAFLRVWQLGPNEPRLAFELEVELSGRAYYVYGCEANRDYRVEIVLRGVGGAEHVLGHQSNVATLPPDRPSAWVEDRFVTIPLEVALPGASVFASTARLASDSERRLHARAFELSGGEAIPGEDHPSSADRYLKGFGTRFWSGTLVRK